MERRRGWHPWVWMMFAGTAVVCFVDGALLAGALCAAVAVWMVR